MRLGEGCSHGLLIHCGDQFIREKALNDGGDCFHETILAKNKALSSVEGLCFCQYERQRIRDYSHINTDLRLRKKVQFRAIVLPSLGDLLHTNRRSRAPML